MPLGILTKQPSFSGIVAGSAGVATTRITPQGKHFATYLYCYKAGGVAMTAAEITASINTIEVLIDGGQIHLARPQTYRDLYFHETGEVLENGIIPIPYYTTKFDTFAERIVTGIGCANVDSFSINLNTNAGAGNVLVNCECFADYNPSINADLGTFRQIVEMTRTILATGEFEDNTVPTYGLDAALCAMHVYPGTNGVCSYLTLKTDDFERASRVPPALLKTENEMCGLHEIAGVTSMHFDLGNIASSLVSMRNVKTIRLTSNWTTAPTTNSVFVLDYLRGVAK